MNEHEVEEKKSFWIIYALVAVFYVAMAITYGVVVHKAAEDGANDVLPSDDAANAAATKDMPAFTEQLYSYVESAILQ